MPLERSRLHWALFAALCFGTGVVSAADPKIISGTYIAGSNGTEPRPAQSRYLQTVHGGVVVIEKMAGLYLVVKVREAPAKPLYLQVRYQDPLGGAPATNDMEFMPTAEELQFSSPSAVRGLKIYADYQVTVRVFESKDATEPVDVLTQTIRSYVDSTGDTPKIFRGIKPRG